MAKHVTRSLFRYEIIVDDIDQHIVDAYTWCTASNGSPRTTINGKQVRLHRLIFPDILLIDHKDNDPLNNKRNNLRPATVMQNSYNRGKASHNTSGYKGVHIDKRLKYKKYCAYITANRLRETIGYYTTAEEAAIAYNTRAIELHGNFAKLNEVISSTSD